ncbi:hypothetical protein [Gordonia caeni]|uniref:Uncharacterized protein n=1 Tax=Gordonia caeni TaxID=1007097 RepID=A0ABP7PH29_9ACTN
MTTRNHTLPGLLLARSANSWGDERERAVMLEAYAYVFILATYLLWTVGAVIAWFIPAWVTVILFLVFLFPSLEWQRYTGARGVDANTLAYTGGSLLRTALTGAYFGACALSMWASAALQWVPDSSSTLRGGLVGGLCGGAAAILFGWWSAKKKAAQSDADVPDEF